MLEENVMFEYFFSSLCEYYFSINSKQKRIFFLGDKTNNYLNDQNNKFDRRVRYFMILRGGI